MEDPRKPTFALVLSGGGARGAYEAGVIYYLRTQLPKEIAHKPLFRIYSGTSVGAINSALMASTAADPIYQGARLRKLWQELTPEDIYQTDTRALAGFLVKSGFFMASNFFGVGHLLERAETGASFPFRAVLDTSPFVNYLRRSVAWSQIHKNVASGLVDAVTVSASHIHSGRLQLFIEKHPDVVYGKGGVQPMFCQLSPKHILASAAVPLIFPIIRINREFYGDGSMRQNTPTSPAIHLGADRLLVISLRTKKPHRTPHTAGDTGMEVEPKVGNVLGHLLNTIFLDKIDYDLDQMRRINYLISDFEAQFGADALQMVNEYRSGLHIAGKVITNVSKVLPFVISPSEDIGAIAADCFTRVLARKETLTPLHKFFSKVVNTEGDNDFMSYLLFDHEYLEALIELGFSDARKEHDRLINFFSNLPLDSPSAA